MIAKHPICPIRVIFCQGWILAVALAFGPVTLAHENHAPLPTKGVTVAGNNVLLSDRARAAIGLTTAKVTFGDLHRIVEVNARVELPWSQQAMITSLVPGRIDRVLVRPGEAVTAGQELARVESMQLEAIQLTLLNAASDVEFAKRLVEQRRGLDAQGVIAGKSFSEAVNLLAQKTAALRIAEEQIRALGVDDETIQTIRTSGRPIRSIPIASPLEGVITHADVRLGQVVKTTDHLYHVVDLSRVWIVGDVLESDVRHLKKGQPVTARFSAHSEKQFDGVIDHVRLKMNGRRRTQSVVIAADNRARLLRPGMSGRLRITVRVARDSIVCPADAIIKSRSGRYVLVERSPGKYENRPVKLGLTRGKRVEILDGAFPGDKVVVTGAYLLASLLGNEHKARTSKTSSRGVSGNLDSLPSPILMADAAVEMPTGGQAFAGPRIEGRIDGVFVEESQRVVAGQILAEVDSLELRTVQLDLLQTVSQLRLVEQSLARLKPLGDRDITPQRRVWTLRNQRDTLAHQTASLKRQLAYFGLSGEKIAELERADFARGETRTELLSSVPIRAPADGWIVGFHVVPGQIVGPEDQLFEIHDLSQVWVKGYVFERDATQLTIGQPARVSFSAFPDVEAAGRVVRIAPVLEETERVLPVWVAVDNPGRLLKDGMLARVAIFRGADSPPNAAGSTAELRPIRSQRQRP